MMPCTSWSASSVTRYPVAARNVAMGKWPMNDSWRSESASRWQKPAASITAAAAAAGAGG